MSTDTTEYGSLREKIRAEKDARLARYASFETLVAAAHAAGLAAGEAVRPTPMIVGSPSTPLGNDIDPAKPTYYVADGACGFAWIKVVPGGSSFARWLVKTGRARAAYNGGVQIWVSEFGQSLGRKSAYSAAYAAVLAEAGIRCWGESRMD